MQNRHARDAARNIALVSVKERVVVVDRGGPEGRAPGELDIRMNVVGLGGCFGRMFGRCTFE